MSLIIGLSAVPIAAVEQHITTNQSTVCGGLDAPASSTLNQPPNQTFLAYSDAGCSACSSGIQVISENFTIGTGGIGFNVDQIVIWGGYLNGSPPSDDDFSALIHADSGGLPSYGPRPVALLFEDGFESGDTSAWD